MVVLEPRAQALTKEGAKHAGSKVAVRPKKQAILTIPDLVLLSLLAERPMHGYEANLEMERRDIRDWAAISRPQVYYSLEKLGPPGLLCQPGGENTGFPLGGPVSPPQGVVPVRASRRGGL